MKTLYARMITSSKGLRLLLAGLALSFSVMAPVADAQVIAGWTFESSQPATAGPHNAEIGTGTALGLHANGATTFSSPSGNGSARAFSSNSWAAGDSYQFSFSTSGYAGISITFDQTGSNTGPETFEVQISTNGTTFTTLAGSGYDLTNQSWSATTANPASTRTFSLPGADNQATVYVRLTVAAGSTAINNSPIASGGTCRIDNVLVSYTTVLPVALQAFTATSRPGGTLLQWNTAAEQNVSHFEVERGSDGRNFSLIGSVKARNRAGGGAYTYNDPQTEDAAYYRLRIVDADGRSEYSPVVAAGGISSNTVAVLGANPVRNVLPLTLPARSEAELYITDMAGKVLRYEKVKAAAAGIDVSALPAGTYLLRLQAGTARQSLKFVKQ